MMRIIALLISYFSLSCGLAQQLSPKEISFVKTIDSLAISLRNQLPSQVGLGITLVHEDKTLLTNGYGISSVETNDPIMEDTKFYIASATKPFTALLAAMLDENGIVPLETTLKEFFPNTVWNDTIDADRITVRHLLSHTMSMTNSPLTWRLAQTGQYTHDQLVSLLDEFSVPNDRDFGEFQYDNAGYNLYTLGLQEKYGINWKDALQQYLFDPGEMKNTSAYLPKGKLLGDLSAKEYAMPHSIMYRGKEDVNEVYASKSSESMQSAGGMVTSAVDLATWLRLQINNGIIDGKQIVSENALIETRKVLADSTDKSFTFQTEAGDKSYSLGWHQLSFSNQEILYHNGGYPGFFTITSFSPSSRLGVAINVNEQFTSRFTAMILARFAYRWWTNPEEAKTYLAAEIKEAIDSELQIRDHFGNDFKSRENRKWKLDFSLDYAGVYSNEERGEMEVIQDGKKLLFKHGNLQSEAEPFPYKNAARIEFEPFKGIATQFDIDKKTKEVRGIRHNKRYFKKISD